jgi:hypothetical protein
LGLSNFDSTSGTFSVKILSVGPDSYNYADLADDGTYHLEKGTGGFTVIRVNASVSGYNLLTDVELGNATFNGLFDVPVVGQIYTIVNGEIQTTQSAVLGTTGFDVILTSDVNVVSLLYVGRAEDGSITWGSDTVTVRVGDLDALKIAPLIPVDVPATVTITDAASIATTLNITGILSANYNSGFNIEQLFTPDQVLSIAYTGTETDIVVADGGELEVTDVSTSDAIAISGTVDSSGFVGQPYWDNFNVSAWLDYWYYLDDTWPLYTDDVIVNATAGLNFVQDASGIKEAADVTSVRFYDVEYTDYAQSEFSVITVAPYGDWDIYTDWIVGFLGGDPNGQFATSTIDSAAAGLTVPEGNVAIASGYTGGVYGANEWVVNSFGVKVSALNTDVKTFTSTVTESPGFGIAMAMTGVAVIAYVSPRLRKE